MRSEVITPERVAHLKKLFTYEAQAGYINRTGTHKFYQDSTTVMISWPDGTKTNMPTTKLAYILAYGRAPLHRVVIRKGINRNKTGIESLIEQHSEQVVTQVP